MTKRSLPCVLLVILPPRYHCQQEQRIPGKPGIRCSMGRWEKAKVYGQGFEGSLPVEGKVLPPVEANPLLPPVEEKPLPVLPVQPMPPPVAFEATTALAVALSAD